MTTVVLLYRLANRRTLRKRETEIEKIERSKERELYVAKFDFFTNIAHEIRTPLSLIRGPLENIVAKTGDSPDRELHEELRTMQSNTDRLTTLINQLLDFRKAEQQGFRLHPVECDVREVVENVCLRFVTMARQKHIDFAFELPAEKLQASADKEALTKIVSNLLSNALKFTQKGAVKLITGYSDGNFILTVDDTGTGIDKEKQDRIFKPFERLGNAATQDGFGLGLPIVKQLVELMNGRISVESVKDKGSKFTVVLPLPKTEETESDGKKEQVQDIISNYSVMVIDNDLVTLSMIRDMLVQNGISCDTCLTVEELTDKMRGKDYDILITDLKMPDMNGYEVLELLRTSDIGNSRTIPIVVVTAAGFITEEELKSAGFTAMLGKPFSIAELLNVVSQYANKEHRQLLDFSALLTFGDRRHTLEQLVTETEKEMDEVQNAAKEKNMEALDGWVHHLRSSWMLMKAEQPLQELYAVIHSDSPTDGEITHAVNAVLAQGKMIVDLARKEAKRWEE